MTRLDTLQISNNLHEAGINKPAAEQIAVTFKESQDILFENLASKDDIQKSENVMRQQMQNFGYQLKLEIKESQNDLESKISKLLINMQFKIFALMLTGFVALFAAIIKF